MLENFLIFSRGGLILWSWREPGNALKQSPVDALIRSHLLEGRSGDAVYQYFADGATYMLKWILQNDLRLVFVAVYQLELQCVDELLAMVKSEFNKFYDPKRMVYMDFNETFSQILKEAETRAENIKKAKRLIKPSEIHKDKSSLNENQNSELQYKEKDSKKSETQADADVDDSCNNGAGSRLSSKGEAQSPKHDSENANGKVFSEAFHDSKGDDDVNSEKREEAQSDVHRIHNLRPRAWKKSGPVLNEKQGKGKLKRKRVSEDMPQHSDMDFTGLSDERIKETVVLLSEHSQSVIGKEMYIDSESEIEEKEIQEVTHSKIKGWFPFIYQSIAEKKVIGRTDLQQPLKILKDVFMGKHVATEIAEKLCESVAVSLEGKESGTSRRMRSTVQGALEEALLHILTAETSIDILKDVLAAKEQSKPYVIVFVGANGVGRSTNLAKVAYWLLQHDVSVMMAACDTFSPGAVEQLCNHAHRLKVPLFEREDEKDPAVVAKDAIQDAIHSKVDVVLVDTAYMKQDDEPSMRTLSKIINLNNPDLILFVGEALVDKDALNQLLKFNQELAGHLTCGKDRLIDGIVLTNFDMNDDKVGGALSMAYIAGAPVVFVGCGESYKDLHNLNIKSIVKNLLK